MAHPSLQRLLDLSCPLLCDLRQALCCLCASVSLLYNARPGLEQGILNGVTQGCVDSAGNCIYNKHANNTRNPSGLLFSSTIPGLTPSPSLKE